MKSMKLVPLVLLLLATLGLSTLTPAFADSVTPPTTTNVIIHKLQMDITPGAVPVPNDGRAHTNAELSTALGVPVRPLPGVVFHYWAITDSAGLDTLNPMSIAALDARYPTTTTLPATDASGTVSAGALASFDALGNPMRYYFREVSIPPNVQTTSASPFILGLPLMNATGDMYLTDVHLYPKNVTVYGKVDLAKMDGEGGFLPDAHFRLYQGTAPSGTEYGDRLVYVTDATGHLTISGLPYGDYYFVETDAPEGYMLDPAPVPFKIAVSEDTATVQVTKTNWSKPAITKSAMTSGQASGSASYNDQFTWVLQPKLPDNIASYDNYRITDTLDPALTYTDNLVVRVGTTTLIQGTHYTVAAPTGSPGGGTLQISLVPSQLGTFSALNLMNNTVVTFTTQINEAAVMGRGITNTATVTYNDNIVGPGSATAAPAYAYTGGKVFRKVAEAEGGTPLAGAQFKVAIDAAGTEYVKDSSGADLVLTSGTDGRFFVKGLAYDLVNGTEYYLVETAAPVVGSVSYNLLQSPVPFRVTGTSFYIDPTVITAGTTSPNAAPDQIVNKTGFQIPQTGGFGTVAFSIAGLLLMGGAVWLLRRRKTASSN